jgi:hypothetical protein
VRLYRAEFSHSVDPSETFNQDSGCKRLAPQPHPSSLGHDAASRHLNLRVVAHQECDYACHDRTGRQHDKAERGFASRLLHPADSIGAGKAPEIADGISVQYRQRRRNR